MSNALPGSAVSTGSSRPNAVILSGAPSATAGLVSIRPSPTGIGGPPPSANQLGAAVPDYQPPMAQIQPRIASGVSALPPQSTGRLTRAHTRLRVQ